MPPHIDAAVDALVRRVFDESGWLQREPSSDPIVVLVDVDGASLDWLREQWQASGLPIEVQGPPVQPEKVGQRVVVQPDSKRPYDPGSVALTVGLSGPGLAMTIEWWSATSTWTGLELERTGQMYGCY